MTDSENIPHPVISWLAQEGYGKVVKATPVGGGCIHNGRRLTTSSGKSFFLKTNNYVPVDMFTREAEGLEALRVPGAVRLPMPLVVGETYLLLEDLRPVPPRSEYWEMFGRQLACLHSNIHPEFGFHHHNYIGYTLQPNPFTPDGYQFFAEHRLLFQAKLALEKGRLSHEWVKKAENLAKFLPEIIPQQPASLLHGDLWSGNALSDEHGDPAMIDPAAYYGWAEAELAMTTLFGCFPDIFYRAYQEVRRLTAGYRERLPIYNLYHLLNHLNMFGGGYLLQVQQILRQF